VGIRDKNLSWKSLGSGKTINAVSDVVHDKSGRVTYSNIEINGINNVKFIRPDHIIRKKIVGCKTKRDGTVEQITKLDLNIDYWMKQKKALNILWDEIHLSGGNSRESMKKSNLIISRFLSMGRRICGFDDKGYGTLIFIAQTDRTIDVNIKDLANEIRYFVMHWELICRDCGLIIPTDTGKPVIDQCFRCNSWDLYRDNFISEVFYFLSYSDYLKHVEGWEGKYYYKRTINPNISEYRKYYDTHQIQALWDEAI